ncbi:hypothetical protein NMY22_g3638 [Coprinellus aureogranulatus]|nr:hypothetical protein NMY22_g3638 [Coprinellus aureogranulatus]
MERLTGHRSVPWWIPRFLITPSIRLYYLRAAIILSPIVTWYAVWLWLLAVPLDRASVAIAIVTSIVVFVHHLVLALVQHFIPLLNLFDLCLHGCETTCAVYLAVELLYWKHALNYDIIWLPKRAVFGLVAFSGLTLTLLALFLLKLLDFVCSPHTIPKKMDRRQSCPNRGDAEDRSRIVGRWKYVAGVLFGRKAWQEKLPGEGNWIRYLRGVATLIILLVLVSYGVYEGILRPIAEMGMVPSNEFRALNLTSTFTASSTIVYNLIAAWKPKPGAPMTLLDASNVDVFPRMENAALNNCSKSMSGLLNQTLGPGYEVVLFECARPIPNHRGPKYDIEDLDFRTYRRPNLQLMINFTSLMSAGSAVSEDVDLTDYAVHVWLAFTENMNDVTNSSSPISLIPGANLLTVADVTIRQKLKPIVLATFGFDRYNTFLAPNFLYTIPNPFSATSTKTQSTLRIVPAFEVGEWVIHQEFRRQSVLSGLSALGGLGSLLSTLLVITLGSTLMQSVRGEFDTTQIFRVWRVMMTFFEDKRPYSPGGFLHNLEKVQQSMREECFKRYPGLQDEMLAFSRDGRKRGVAAFLLDTLIDMENLTFTEDSVQAGRTQ